MKKWQYGQYIKYPVQSSWVVNQTIGRRDRTDFSGERWWLR